jgi:hypothetical protein
VRSQRDHLLGDIEENIRFIEKRINILIGCKNNRRTKYSTFNKYNKYKRDLSANWRG